MIRMAGLVTRVYARSQKRALPPEIDMDDTTALLLDFAGGATGALTAVFVTGDYWRVAAYGTKRWLEIRNDTEIVSRGLAGAPQRTQLEPVDRERAELEAFADAVAARQPFLVPPEQMVNGIAVLESIEKSSARGRAIEIKP